MFRKKSLEKLQTPDSLDQLLVVVRPRAVFTFGTLAVVFIIAVIWSIVARIPITVGGHGILLKPRSIRTIQSSGGGVVTDVSVFVGEHVKAGQIIVKVEQPEFVRQLEQQLSEYRTMSEFHKKAMSLSEQRRDLEVSLLDQNLRDNEEARQSLKEIQQKIRTHMAAQEKQVKSVSALVDEGVTSDSQRLSMQAMLTDTEQRLMRMEQELASLGAQRKQMEMQRKKAQQDYELDVHSRTQGLVNMAAGIRLTKERLYRQSGVRSRYQGRVLEVAATVGQVIGSATRVAILQVEAQEPFFRVELAEDASQGTFALVYRGYETRPIPFNATPEIVQAAIQDLELVKRTGDTVRVVHPPGLRAYDVYFKNSAVKKEDGELQEEQMKVKDSSLTALDGTPTFAAVTEMGDLVPQEELRHLGFLSIGDGKRVEAGMQIRIDPANIERQRFGSMIGQVKVVSSFPVTSEGLVNMIGNKEVVESLLQQGGTILVEADLEKSKENLSGYRWTSKGPDSEITAGTTTTCRVTVEERRPITFAIPLLRKWFLGEADKGGVGKTRPSL